MLYTGLSACGPHYYRGACASQEGGQAASPEDRVLVVVRWTDVRAAVPAPPQEAAAGGHTTVHSSVDSRRVGWCVLSKSSFTWVIMWLFIDHEERIALFTRASDSDAELPYGPLLRCAIHYSVQYILASYLYLTECSTRKTTLYN